MIWTYAPVEFIEFPLICAEVFHVMYEVIFKKVEAKMFA